MEQTERLAGKVIVVGVTGGIAAFKAAHLVTGLRKFGAEVHFRKLGNQISFSDFVSFIHINGVDDGFHRGADVIIFGCPVCLPAHLSGPLPAPGGHRHVGRADTVR